MRCYYARIQFKHTESSTMNSKRRLLVFLCVHLFIVLCVDVCVFAFFNQPLCYGVFCWTILYMLSFEVQRALLAFVLLLIESFLFSGQVALPMACYGLMALFLFHMRRFCYLNRLFFITISVLLLLVHVYLIEGGLAYGHGYNYTFIKMGVNIIIIAFLSLKLRFQSSQDNRCLG